MKILWTFIAFSGGLVAWGIGMDNYAATLASGVVFGILAMLVVLPRRSTPEAHHTPQRRPQQPQRIEYHTHNHLHVHEAPAQRMAQLSGPARHIDA